MLEAIKYTSQGNQAGTIVLNDNVFAVSTRNKSAVMYEVIKMYLANQRQGNASVKGRSEVKGTSAKMYRQKGTGNARAGSRRSPVRVGGGVAFGPRSKDWYRKIPKKKKRLALKLALSEKAVAGKIFVIESLSFDKPNTKQAISIIDSIFGSSSSSISNKTNVNKATKLIVTDDSNDNVIKSFNNVPKVIMDRADSIYAYEVLKAEYLLLTEKSLEIIETCFDDLKINRLLNTDKQRSETS